MSEWRVTDRDGGALLDIVVKPRSSVEGIGPMKADRLCVSVNSPPVDGKANAAVIRVLADVFGVPKGAISIIRGETGRKKTVRVGNCTAEAVLRQVTALLG